MKAARNQDHFYRWAQKGETVKVATSGYEPRHDNAAKASGLMLCEPSGRCRMRRSCKDARQILASVMARQKQVDASVYDHGRRSMG